MITIDVPARPVVSRLEFKTNTAPVAAYIVPVYVDLYGFTLIKGMIADKLVRGDFTIHLPVFQDGNEFLLEDYYQQFSKRFSTLENAIAWANEVEAKDYYPEVAGLCEEF